ncbi:MAG: DUF2397 family protein [Kiritimatiellae bacterium]|nr:DUF2397 family protein [Kiritimatiellia bacterium]
MEFSFSKLGTPPCRHQWRHFCYNTDMKKVQPDDDLFAPADLRSDVYSGSEASVASESVRLIDSPLVAETADWLGDKTKELGSLLSSDRAVEYVAILRAFAEFRRHHEPEPLHEDIVRAVCGEMPDPFAELTLKNDLRQLKDWSVVTERIEKERLRGYRDNRRTKFRYRLCDEAAQFIDWLAERRVRPLDVCGGDITVNLLDLQCSLLHELRRKLRTVTPTGTNADTAGDVLYRVEQLLGACGRGDLVGLDEVLMKGLAVFCMVATLSVARAADESFAPALFWWWNSKLDAKALCAQVDDFYEHGFRTLCIHPFPKGFRPAKFPCDMEPDYLTGGYLDVYAAVTGHAAAKGMACWLYDEGGWPSGGACGQVVASDPARFAIRRVEPGRDGRAEFTVERYDPREKSPYPSVIEPGATDRFLELTHERLKTRVGRHFGKAVPWVFTDEPSAPHGYGRLGWSTDFAREFRSRKGYDVEPLLTEMLRNGPARAEVRRARIDCYDVMADLFVERFLLPCRDWSDYYTGSKDFSAGLKMAYDDEGLLLKFHVKDDMNVPSKPGVCLAEADALKLALAKVYLYEKTGNNLLDEYEEAQTLYSFGFDAEGRPCGWRHVSYDHQKDRKHPVGEVKIGETGYELKPGWELRIPWHAINCNIPKPGDVHAIGLRMYDYDAKPNGWFCGHGAFGMDLPETFGAFVIGR